MARRNGQQRERLIVNERIAVSFFEIDIRYCDLTYGEGLCEAELGVTGAHKCFNTRNFKSDCQDPANYTGIYKTIRFGVQGQAFVASMPCIPSMTAEPSVRNAEIHPGEDIGIRAEFSVSFEDHPHGDAGIDKYIADRAYNPFEVGTFWGKFRARNPYLQNVPCRVIRGYVGSNEWDIEHFVLSSMTGPDANGKVSMSGRDFLYLLADKSAQAPRVSQGYLAADLAAGVTSLTLEPIGIGASYPATGKWSIGEESMLFTKTGGDNFTVTRAEDGTEDVDHDADEVAQITLEYDSETVAYILNDLTVNYSPIDSSHINLPLWESKVAEFSDTLYSTRIVKPTAVEKLYNELIEQAGLVINGNTRTQQIDFDVLRPDAVTGELYDERKILTGTFRQVDQPRKRYSQVWVFYNQRDVYKNLDEPTNFYSGVAKFPPENRHETDSIKKIYSRWIPKGARTVANDVAGRALSRYVNPPRMFAFSLFAGEKPQLGQTSPISLPAIQNCFGFRDEVNAIFTGIKTKSAGFDIQSEELLFDASLIDLNRTFTIDYDALNINLRELYDNTYSEVDEVNPITFIVESSGGSAEGGGVVVGSVGATLPSIDTGFWPGGVVPTLIVRPAAFVVGKGGDAGYGAQSGKPGGLALKVRVPFAVDNQGVIGGGGGGGGGGTVGEVGPSFGTPVRGGGGAGSTPGIGATNGTLEEGGSASGPSGGGSPGGDLGQAGSGTGSGGPITHYPGGAAGVAVDGDSLITWINEGDIRGARIG
jgi:hypothetical protein